MTDGKSSLLQAHSINSFDLTNYFPFLGVKLSQSHAERPAALGSEAKRNGDGRAQYYFSPSQRVRAMLGKLKPKERKEALRGLALLAEAARKLSY